jgi:peptidoglycan/LPS O-acetylase OafA/YrhL
MALPVGPILLRSAAPGEAVTAGDNQRRMAAGETSGGTAAVAAGARRVPALDGFRAYALLGVVTVHLLGASGVLRTTEGTGAGVALWSVFGNTIDVFFIISGFGLFLPTVRRGGEFGSKARFWIARAARLFPAYWLVLAIAIVLLAVAPEVPATELPSLGDLAAHLAVLQMPMALLDSDFRIGFGLNGPVWLLSIIVGFYVVLPFVARPYYRHPLVGLALAAAVTIAWKQTVDWAPEVFEGLTTRTPEAVAGIAVDQFPGWAFSFGLGMTAAWAYELARGRIPRRPLSGYAARALLIVLPAYALAAWLYGRDALTAGGNIGLLARQDTLETMLLSALRAAFVFIVICGPLWLQRPFANRLVGRLADLSYGLYLIHWVLIAYLHQITGLPTTGTFGDLIIWAGVVLPPSLLFAALSRRWVELPVQAWVRRRLDASSRLGPPVAADAPARS